MFRNPWMLRYAAPAALLLACSTESSEPIGRAESAVVGVDTFLYFRCNATGWQPNVATRLRATGQPGVFSLAYDVTQPWMVRGGGQGDDCVFTETNRIDSWGTFQRYYSSTRSVTVPGGSTLSPGSSNPRNFRVLYPALGRFEVRVDWPRRSFDIQAAARASLELIHSGTSATVHAIRQDVSPQAGLRTLELPPLTENIAISADGGALQHQIVVEPNAIETIVTVEVPAGTRTLRIEYDVLDGSLPFNGRWYLKHNAPVIGPRQVGIRLPPGAAVDLFEQSDMDPDPLRLAFELGDGQTADVFVNYHTPDVPDLYDHIETPHYAVHLAHAHRRYQPALLGLLENLYTLYGEYTDNDVNVMEGQERYSYSFAPEEWLREIMGRPVNGSSSFGFSEVNAKLVPRIALPLDNRDNVLVAVTGQELGNGWWHVWSGLDDDNQMPSWINNEGHGSFFRAESSLDLGYCADAQREHDDHYRSFVTCQATPPGEGCGGYILIESLKSAVGWGPFLSYYAAVRDGELDLRGLTDDVARASEVIRFFADQANLDLAPIFDEARVSMTDEVRAELLAKPKLPIAIQNAPILTELACREQNTLRAVPNPVARFVIDDATTAEVTAFVCGPGGWNATVAGAGLSLLAEQTPNCGTAVVTANLASSGFGTVGALGLSAPGLLGSPKAVPVTLIQVPELVMDGGFEQPLGSVWSSVVFTGSASFALDSLVVREGATSLFIDAPTEDDARMVQSVAVQPNTNYRLSGWIRTENVRDGAGAVLVVEGNNVNVTSLPLFGTRDWTFVWLVADSGDSTTLQAEARLGGGSAMSRGRAWYDGLHMQLAE